jgi:hypothetical protein
MGAAIAQIEPFRFPIRVPHEDPPSMEGNPAPADTRIGGKGMTFVSATSHNEDTCVRSRRPRDYLHIWFDRDRRPLPHVHHIWKPPR